MLFNCVTIMFDNGKNVNLFGKGKSKLQLLHRMVKSPSRWAAAIYPSVLANMDEVTDKYSTYKLVSWYDHKGKKEVVLSPGDYEDTMTDERIAVILANRIISITASLLLQDEIEDRKKRSFEEISYKNKLSCPICKRSLNAKIKCPAGHAIYLDDDDIKNALGLHAFTMWAHFRLSYDTMEPDY